nr:immunoglobulin light chain junction region [Macaca mulatta]
CQQHNSDPITF